MAQQDVTIKGELELSESKSLKNTLSSLRKKLDDVVTGTRGASKGTRLEKIGLDAQKASVRIDRLAKKYNDFMNQPLSEKAKEVDKLNKDYERALKRFDEAPKGTQAEDNAWRVANSRAIDYESALSEQEALIQESQTVEWQLARETEFLKAKKTEVDAIALAISDTEHQFAKVTGQLSGLSEDIDNISDIGESVRYSNEEIAKMSERLATLKSIQQDLEASGKGLGTEEYDKNVTEIDRLEVALRTYKDSLQTTSQSVRENAQAEREAAQAAKEKASAEARASKEQERAKQSIWSSISSMSSLGSSVMRFSQTLSTVITATGSSSKFLSGLQQAAHDTAPAFGVLGKAAQGFGKVIKGVGTVVKGLGKHFKSSSSSSDAFGSKLKKLSSFLTKYILGFRSFFYLYRRLRGQIGEGFKELAQGVPSVNTAFSSVLTGLYQLRAGFAAAFEPVISLIVPILNTLIAKLNDAMTSLANFFATLTGKSTILKATVAQQDYAKSLDSTSKSAGSANKNMDKFTAGIDELNVLDSDSASGGGGGGADSILPSYEEVAAEQSKLAMLVGGLAMMIKDAWEKSDFTEVGRVIGDTLKQVLDNLPLDFIRSWAEKIARCMGTFINGFISSEGLGTSIGATLGEMINIAFNTLYTFVTTIDWASVGKFIGDAFNGLVDSIDFVLIGNYIAEKFNAIFDVIGNMSITIDWEGVGSKLASSINAWVSTFNWAENAKSLSDLVKGLLSTIIRFLEDINWQELGTKIAEFISNIDWSGLVSALLRGIGAALGAFAGLIWGILKGAWENVVTWWQESAYEDGKFTMEGLLRGVGDVLKNIGTWIVTNVFTPFIKGFKKAFGIASPSKVMQEQGTFLMQGLLEGIISKADEVVQKFIDIKDRIVQTFSELKDKAIALWEEMWSGIKNVINSVLYGIEAFANGIIKGINTAIEAINNLAIDIPDWVPVVGGESIGFHIPTLSEISIPKLAEGAVLPANQPFMAMVGDQKHGTNVEAPLETIRQAVADVTNSDGIIYAIQTLTDVVEALNLTVNLDSKKIESGTRAVAQRRGVAIARGGIINYT